MRRWNRHLCKLLRNQHQRATLSGSQAFSSIFPASSSRPLDANGELSRTTTKPTRQISKNAIPVLGLNQNGDTIYALSTAPGRAAIAVIRISGPAALTVYRSLCPSKPAAPKPRHATLRTLYNPSSSDEDDKILDSGALVLYFPAPETATGEDILELHVHGGTAVVKSVLTAIPNSVPASKGKLPAIRYAEPGEFTRRAFYNDRLDLLQIEALANTLSAETEQQRRLAVRSSRNSPADRYEAWRQKLLHARGELEALIDFSEDQHFEESPAELCASVARHVDALVGQLKANIESAARGELLRNGISVALVGAPNAGKSSLFNCVVGREAAIVSQEAGTTRDVVEVSVDIGGFLCRFGDVAGLRDGGKIKDPFKEDGRDLDDSSISAIEQEGMRRARERALTADVVIVICSLFQSQSRSHEETPSWTARLEPEIASLLQQLNPQTQKVVCVLNKTDLLPSETNLNNTKLLLQQPLNALANHSSLTPFLKSSHPNRQIYPLSCTNATLHPPTSTSQTPDPGGLQTLLHGLTQLFRDMTSAITPETETHGSSDAAWAAESLGATERQRILLERCVGFLGEFLDEVRPTPPLKSTGTATALGNELDETGDEEAGGGKEGGAGEWKGEIDIVLAAESLRAAAECLARITGRGEGGDVEEVLGVVFERFVAYFPPLLLVCFLSLCLSVRSWGGEFFCFGRWCVLIILCCWWVGFVWGNRTKGWYGDGVRCRYGVFDRGPVPVGVAICG